MNETQPFLFTISQFGRKTGMTVRTLRFYEEIGVLIPTEYNKAGHRLYSMADLVRLQQIQALKFIGYSLQEIKEMLLTDDDEVEILKKSLPMQLKLLKEKRDEYTRAIEGVEFVQKLIDERKPISWKILSSVLYRMEREDEQRAWMEEHFPKEAVGQFLALPKEKQDELDMEMLEVLADIKDLIQKGVRHDSEEAFEILVRITEISLGSIADTEAFLEQMEQVDDQLLKEADFHMPHFLTEEEEKWLEAVGNAMEKKYMESEQESDTNRHNHDRV
ncbi:MerR family transcriptional regulator [Alkalihalobacillus pseudalcaliphilus]|uniref:MerR family transcriptional regulator n=1 Tax=Alkalihalobacillus pseudalcaliphilus TaxID=79884 RepID=UPI00064DF1A8|nr:MerR family transcriptional regulator [Alkalihalobacillus pseudalcaliphilus]KMK75877.1 MerR family transcriptional regulator [Alkalihalobacillus pseudalcaliphilus]